MMEITVQRDLPSFVAIVRRMQGDFEKPALFWNGRELSYGELLDLIGDWQTRLAELKIGPGMVCGLLGDYTPQTVSLMWALMLQRSVLVPFGYPAEAEVPGFVKIAGVAVLFRFKPDDSWSWERFGDVSGNELIAKFRAQNRPGLVVFTSGSTGKPKGILHDCERVLHKFVKLRDAWRTALFLMIDHFGGFNTWLSTFAYGGVGVCLPNRTPEAVCRTIEASKATLLPTTPTFLNLLIASGCYRDFDLTSVRLITYGTELMPESTLQRVLQVFPSAKIKQTYGLSELGVLRSRSEADSSLWVKVGGDGFDVKVVDNTLWVRSSANMIGYLNAPSPFDTEGWMCTGDQVEVQGEYIRFLGRKSELISVGGQKVFPIEVETALLEMENVREATVYGVPHRLLGQVVHARISLETPEDVETLNERLRRGCLAKLARYKVPVRFVLVAEEEQRGARFKKIRAGLKD